MAIKPGAYADILRGTGSLKWKPQRDAPKGTREAVLQKHKDGSYTHLVRIPAGVEFPDSVAHPFHEEAYYIEGAMLNTRTRHTIRSGTYVYHRPGEEHGPFRCLKACLILEFRYYK
jgi:ChrR Cupin-like domain